MKLGIVPENLLERFAILSGLLPPGIFESWFSVAICRRYPQLRSIILDLPQAIQHAAPLLAKEGMGDRGQYFGNARRAVGLTGSVRRGDFMVSDVPGEKQLGQYRSYLKFLARVQLDPRLRTKVDDSDLVQQALLAAHRAIGEYSGTTNEEMAAWLRQILARSLTHAVRDAHREKRDIKRERSLEVLLSESSTRLEGWLADEQSSPSQRAQRNVHMLRVANALEELPAAQRDAIALHYWQGWSPTEIAAHLDRTPAAVAGLLLRGLKKLRIVLAEKE